MTNPEITSKYYYGSKVRSDLKNGFTIEFIIIDEAGQETVPVSGIIEGIVQYKLPECIQ